MFPEHRRVPASQGEQSEEEALDLRLALRLREGLVFLADTRTNAGADDVGTYRKTARPGAQARSPVRDRVGGQPGDDPGGPRPHPTGTWRRTMRARAWPRRGTSSRRPSTWAAWPRGRRRATGQRSGGRGGRHRHLHPRGSRRIGASRHPPRLSGGQLHPGLRRAPVLQIGESKYGKFMLELAVEADVDLVTAAKIALGSMMSTARANLSVGSALRRRHLPRTRPARSASSASSAAHRCSTSSARCGSDSAERDSRAPGDHRGRRDGRLHRVVVSHPMAGDRHTHRDDSSSASGSRPETCPRTPRCRRW